MVTNKKEIVVGLILIILLIALINPGDLFMPSMFQMTILALVMVAFALFAIMVWRERGGDERDRLHRFIADRIGFWTGGIVLMGAIIIQEFMHLNDPWLPVVLGALVLGKIAGLMYSKTKY